MKQHITPEQLDELTNKQKNKLNKWLQKNNYSSYAIVSNMLSMDKTVTSYVITPMSIGQMIEFLNEYYLEMEIYRRVDMRWFVGNKPMMDTYDNKELCDALWEAVKKVLDK